MDKPGKVQPEIAETALEATVDQSPAAEVGGDVSRLGQCISHYRIERRLGAGGMGQVYLAKDMALGRWIALKILPDSFSPALRERLFREAWASARMQHPAIATFYEAGEFEGVAFVAMEYIDGWTLKDEIARGPVRAERAVSLMSRLLEGLAHAHAAEILHRDIKPANIMCTAAGEVKLLDFGLARHSDELVEAETPSGGPQLPAKLDADATREFAPEKTTSTGQLNPLHGLTQHGAILGTFGYMSPEQLRGLAVDTRTDVFAMGAVFYEMLTGRAAFQGESTQQRAQATLELTPPPIQGGELPAAINPIIQRAIHKLASERYPSATELLRDLRMLDHSDGIDAEIGRVAVLDLENRTGLESLDWLATGIADELSARFQRAGVTVIPRPAVSEARKVVVATETELGLHLGIRWLVSGSFGKDGEVIKICVRLLDVPAMRLEHELEASESLERLFELQERVATDVLRFVSPKNAPLKDGLSSTGPPVEAYERYVRARREIFRYGKANFDRAEEYLARAVEIHPEYSQAWSGLAQIAAMRFLFSHDPSTLEKAIELAERGIEEDSDLAEPWIWLGYARAQQIFISHHPENQGESLAAWKDADGYMRRALELEPESPMATYFAATFAQIGSCFGVNASDRRARRNEALALYQHNLKIASHSCWSWLGIGWVHLDLGNSTEAKWCLERAVELEPKVTPPTAGVAVFLGECLRRIGILEESRERCLVGLRATEDTDHMYRDTFRGVGLCALGRTTLELGDQSASSAAFRQAALHLRGRTRARIGGQLLVQALAGLTRAGEGPDPFEEAVAIFTARTSYEFGWLWWGWDEITLLELARAARSLGRTDEEARFLKAAIDAGSVEALSLAGNG